MVVTRDFSQKLVSASKVWPSITITGPRRSGKTTLARHVFPGYDYANLEDPIQYDFARNDPHRFLSQFRRGVIIDEVQRVPAILSSLQVLIDEDPKMGRWILTGSKNFTLLDTIRQSLAGRTRIYHLLPLGYSEVERFPIVPVSLEETLFMGSYPRLFKHPKIQPSDWQEGYVASYLERDVQNLKSVEDVSEFRMFMTQCAKRSGQLLNYDSLAKDCQISTNKAKAWMSILEASYITFTLPAFSVHVGRRGRKMPKLHFYDTGLVCWLLEVNDAQHLRSHPNFGHIFETWVASEVVKARANLGRFGKIWHYRDPQKREADILLASGSHIIIIEAKSSKRSSPMSLDATKAVQEQLSEDNLTSSVVVVYGGHTSYKKAHHMLSWKELSSLDYPTLEAFEI